MFADVRRIDALSSAPWGMHYYGLIGACTGHWPPPLGNVLVQHGMRDPPLLQFRHQAPDVDVENSLDEEYVHPIVQDTFNRVTQGLGPIVEHDTADGVASVPGQELAIVPQVTAHDVAVGAGLSASADDVAMRTDDATIAEGLRVAAADTAVDDTEVANDVATGEARFVFFRRVELEKH